MGKENWQLTRGQRLSYSVGMFSSAIVTANILAWVLYYYSPPPNKVDAGMIFFGAALAIGFARLFGSLVDAVTNPLVGYWSDRSKNPAGRRIPFIRKGVIPLMILAALVWFPPVRGASIWNVLWLAGTLGGTWFFYTYVVAPYLALMPEITTDPEERVSLTVTMSYFEVVASLIAALAIPPIIESLKDGVSVGPIYFPDGFKFTALILAVLGGIGFYVAIKWVKEKPAAQVATPEMSLSKAILECFRNPSFPPYLIAVSFAKIANNLIMISVPFIAAAVLMKGEGFTSIMLAPLFLAAIPGFAIAEKIVNKVGLKSAFRGATFVATLIAFGFLGAWLMGGAKKEFKGVAEMANQDVVMFFDAKAQGDVSKAPVGMSDNGDATLIRITPMQWQSLFFDADLETFHKRVEGMTEAEAAACIRTDSLDLPAEVKGKEKAWLATAELDPLLLHLSPACTNPLFPAESVKRRYDEAMFIEAPRFVALDEATGSVRLAMNVGAVREPEEAENLDGWKIMVAQGEEREALRKPIPPLLSKTAPFEFDGKIAFHDGSVTFSEFKKVSGDLAAIGGGHEAAVESLTNVMADETKLNGLIARFDMRFEYAWSLRIYLALLLFFVLGFPAAILMSMYRPIVCEVIDLDEQRVGTRREAIYFGVEGLLTKFADGISALLAPAIMLLGHLLLPPPFGYVLPFAGAGIFMILAYLVFGKYPLGPRPDAKK